jgi:hypothetical protein
MIQATAKARKMRFMTSAEFSQKLNEKEKPPPTPVKQESDEPALSSDEVAQWLELFGPAPEIAPPPKPVRRKTAVQKKPKADSTQQDTSPRTAKRGERKLSHDEVDQWLDIFGGQEDNA